MNIIYVYGNGITWDENNLYRLKDIENIMEEGIYVFGDVQWSEIAIERWHALDYVCDKNKDWVPYTSMKMEMKRIIIIW